MKALAILLLAALPGAAADPRVRVVPYEPGAVTALTGHYGYQMLISLAEAERIENISIGDSVAWLVTPNKAANGLFLKPVEPDAATNMTVQTSVRTYLFELTARRATRGGATPGMTYQLAFRYPATAAPTPTPTPPAIRHRAYRMSGAARLRPDDLFDDGRATWFRWPAGAQVPAIFAREGKREALVEHRVKDGYVVVDRLGDFSLRNGRDRLRVRRLAIGGDAK